MRKHGTTTTNRLAVQLTSGAITRRDLLVKGAAAGGRCRLRGTRQRHHRMMLARIMLRPPGKSSPARPAIISRQTRLALGSGLCWRFCLGLGQQQNDQPDEDHHCTDQPHRRQVSVAGIDVEAAGVAKRQQVRLQAEHGGQ